MNFYTKAKDINNETVEHRREIHGFAELNYAVDNTAAYVRKKLESWGYEVREIIKNGLVTEVGSGERTLALRADTDALPMVEETGLPFAATNGNFHGCGHDLHTAMLLSAAKILKENEDKLNARIRIYFQPAEEFIHGSRDMVEAGLLDGVDNAVMFHVDSQLEEGVYVKDGEMATASKNFRITIKGKGAHGAMPENGVDSVYIGAHIVIALSELTAREVSFRKGGVLTTSHFKGGSAPNIIADETVIEGTLRSYNMETVEYISNRIVEVSKGIASTFRASAEVEFLTDTPAIVNDKELADFIKDALMDEDYPVYPAEAITATDDFSEVSTRVPSVMMMLGVKAGENPYPLHHPKVLFNEESMSVGVAAFVKIALSYK